MPNCYAEQWLAHWEDANQHRQERLCKKVLCKEERQIVFILKFHVYVVNSLPNSVVDYCIWFFSCWLCCKFANFVLHIQVLVTIDKLACKLDQ